LAERIDQLATDPDFYTKTVLQAETLKTQLSWEALKPQYVEVLG
jgi:hypothetical protein